MKKGTLVTLTLFVMMALGMGFVAPQQAEAILWNNGVLTVDVTVESPTFHIQKGIVQGEEAGIYLIKIETPPKPEPISGTTDIATLDAYFVGAEVFDENDEQIVGERKGTFSLTNLASATEYLIGVYEKTGDTYNYYKGAPSINTVKITRFTDQTQTETEISETAPMSFITGGEKPDEPVVLTGDPQVSKVGDVISVTVIGEVTNFAEAKIAEENNAEEKICWSESVNPTPDNGECIDASALSANFTVTFTSTEYPALTTDKTYYVRAYAKNSAAPVYAEDKSFSTASPTVTTSAVTDYFVTSATVSGEVTGASATERGVVLSETADPEIGGVGVTKMAETPLGTEAAFSVEFTGLSENMTYNVRAYATNDFGTKYGVNRTFTTPVAGDFDGSGTPGLSDVIVCLKVASGLPVSVANAKADVSGNGKIDTADAALILMDIATP